MKTCEVLGFHIHNTRYGYVSSVKYLVDGVLHEEITISDRVAQVHRKRVVLQLDIIGGWCCCKLHNLLSFFIDCQLLVL